MRFELTSLGSASQSPTRERGQGGHVLRWDDQLVLFDPGEGCQRQLLFAGLSAAVIDRVIVTHFHGDHCLGLPGLLQARVQTSNKPLPVHYPRASQHHFEALLEGSIIDGDLHLRPTPMEPGDVVHTRSFDLSCAALSHPVPTLGYRLEARPSVHLVPERLDEFGVEGFDIGEVRSTGSVEIHGRTVTLDQVSEIFTGPSMAFVMDTAMCDGARELAAGVDLLVCESTFLERDRELARAHGHVTATEAALLAADAGARTLVLAHFSNRYHDVAEIESEARSSFPATVAARDLSSVAVDAPARPRS